MVELVRRQVERIRGHLLRIGKSASLLCEGQRFPYASDERRIWGSLVQCLADCEYELDWLLQRMERAEGDRRREIGEIVDKELRRRESEEKFRRDRLTRAVAPRLDPQRGFSALQKQEIFLRGNGHCVACGSPLDSDWHADHVVPHSRGGRTEVVNGQSLCQPCNSRKSAKVLTVDGGELASESSEDQPDSWEAVWMEENPGQSLVDARLAAARIHRETNGEDRL